MTTKLDSPLKREVVVDGEAYTLTLSADGLKLVAKGRRKGWELSWRALLNGDAALAAALSASVGHPGTLDAAGKRDAIGAKHHEKL